MSTIRFNREALLHFYDDRNTKHFESLNPKGHVSGITGMIGEALMIGLLCQYLSETCLRDGVEVLDDVPRELGGTRKLDAWIACRNKTRLFQVEIKNWSAHSKGGRDMPLEAAYAVLDAEAQLRWHEYFADGTLLPDSVDKVWMKCRAPLPDFSAIRSEPLLSFWHPIARSANDAMSCYEKKDGQRLWVFSGSLYLRQLKTEHIEIQSPHLSRRLQLLNTLCRLT
ncbi:hypothetical protein [Nevskia sp.]|uniref:hypothetical protein n=1 Tax=Nevskia sp. TaxID=1929292 RepID=UPI003F6FC261